MEEIKKTNEIIIADRGTIDVYNGECLFGLQTHDQIILSTVDRYLDKVKEICNTYAFLGVQIDKEYIQQVVGKQKVDMLALKSFLNGLKENSTFNEIIIGDKDFRTYIGICLSLLRYHNKIVFSANNSHTGSMLYIAQALNAVGVETDEEYKNDATQRMEIKKKTEPTSSARTGRTTTQELNKLGLTKCEEIFERDIQLCIGDLVISINQETLRLALKSPEFVEEKDIRVQGRLNIKKETTQTIGKNGRPEILKLNKIGLTKIPELFRFTNA